MSAIVSSIVVFTSMMLLSLLSGLALALNATLGRLSSTLALLGLGSTLSRVLSLLSSSHLGVHGLLVVLLLLSLL